MLRASRWALALGVSVGVLGLLSSCGEGSGDDRAGIRQAVRDLQSALAAGDLEAACDRLTEDAQRHVGDAAHDPPKTCVQDLKMIYEGLKAGEGLSSAVDRKVTKVAVDGDHAMVVVSAGRGPKFDVPLAKADGEWKVDALYGGISADRQVDNFGPTGGPPE